MEKLEKLVSSVEILKARFISVRQERDALKAEVERFSALEPELEMLRKERLVLKERVSRLIDSVDRLISESDGHLGE